MAKHLQNKNLFLTMDFIVGCKDGKMQKKFQDIKKNGILNVTILFNNVNNTKVYLPVRFRLVIITTIIKY